MNPTAARSAPPGLRLAAMLLPCLLAFMASGCASIVAPDNHASSIRVSASCGDLRNIGARCRLTGQDRSVAFNTPATVRVPNSVEPLALYCSGDMVPESTTLILPRPHAAMLGNVLVGGVVGAAVDVASGRGLYYPPRVNVHSDSCR